ncbi:MAG TPA: DM13 domain-containing protein [Actinomycetota bacterium]|nr:DM13 domain-containing protein [Actinomycetota bacterium]
MSEEWGVCDDGEYADPGALKGNMGSSNYEIPAALDLATFETAVVWCRRFTVRFGVAPLTPQ